MLLRSQGADRLESHANRWIVEQSDQSSTHVSSVRLDAQSPGNLLANTFGWIACQAQQGGVGCFGSDMVGFQQSNTSSYL